MNSRFSSGAAEELEALPANGLRPPWYGLVWLANGLVWLGSGFMCVAPPARCIVAPPGCAMLNRSFETSGKWVITADSE